MHQLSPSRGSPDRRRPWEGSRGRESAAIASAPREGKGLMRSLLTRAAVALGMAVAAAGLAAAPAYADGAATVTMMCTQFGTALLPANAPPVKSGIITVEVNGQIITT